MVAREVERAIVRPGNIITVELGRKVTEIQLALGDNFIVGRKTPGRISRMGTTNIQIIGRDVYQLAQEQVKFKTQRRHTYTANPELALLIEQLGINPTILEQGDTSKILNAFSNNRVILQNFIGLKIRIPVNHVQCLVIEFDSEPWLDRQSGGVSVAAKISTGNAFHYDKHFHKNSKKRII